MKNKKCRFCNAELKHIFVDLGKTPLANSFLNADSLKSAESFYPLRAFVCSDCLLVQLEDFEKAENIFSNYLYFSSYSDSWLKHANDYVEMMIPKFKINEKSMVIEIASNDGYLLQFFKKRNISVLGIEPASNVAKIAEEKGIPTIKKFFGTTTAKELVSEGKKADLLLGNNVLAHVPDLNDFVAGMKIILKSDGIITMEFPHLLQLIRQNQFDTIYHEHFSYFSLLVVEKIFSYHGMTIFDVEELPTHGGSLRIFVKHSENSNLVINPRVKNLIKKEKEFELDNIETYTNFSEKVLNIKKNTINFLTSIKKEGKTIVCYGAPAKGNTFLNFCGIDSRYVSYAVDKSPYKQELFLPGTHIPIKDTEEIRKTKPDYLLILPWNLKDEIMTQMSYIRNWGGKFMIAIPEVEIL